MAVSEGDIGYGTLLEVRSGESTSDAYVEIAEVTDLTPPSDSVDEVETTHMQSPDGAKEFTPGLTDSGSMSVTINYVPGSETDEFILAWKASKEKRQTKITYVSGRTQEITTWVKTYNQAVPVQGVMSATLELRCTGGSTFSWVGS